jgi:RHS repeat-associated protein
MRLSFVSAAVMAAMLSPAAVRADRPAPGSVTAERLKLPSGPSSVRGLADEPSVDPFMALLQYQVPIELPSGLGSLTPSLALTYSGALGNGSLGIGWTLAETKIQRSTRLGVPQYDDTDELEISGIASGRLIAIGGGEYRVEGQGQTVRVRKVGDSFEVDDGNGIRFKLGVTAGAREQRDATSILAWRLEEQTNAMGERIRYTYTRHLGQLYLARIVWGPTDVYSVDLTYAARTDVTTSYREGYRVDTAKRLAAIKVTAFGVQRRSYALAYDATFPVARLAGVTSKGKAGGGAWPALSFTYAAPAAPAISPVTGIGNWRLNASGTTLADLDGDGAAELLQLASGGHSYLTNQNGAFGGLQPMTGNAQAISALQLQDLDGDGRVELMQDTGNGWAVYKFSRTQWVSQAATLPDGVWPGSPGLALKQPSATRFAEIDGDGMIDALEWDNDNVKVHFATRTGIAPAINVPRIGGTTLPSAQGRFHDANGDGLDDYFVIGTSQIDRYLGRGDGTFEPAVAIAYPFAGSISNPEDIELADLDRDGLMDLVRIELGTVRWFRGLPNGAFVTTPVTLNNPETLSTAVVVAVTDLNGNGSQDVVWSSSSGMWRMDLAGTTTAGMLVGVKNGLGLDVTFGYRSSHALAVEAQLAGSPWGSTIPIAMPVPVQQITALGAGETTRKVSYGVRDPFWDAIEQRFGGFLTTTVTTDGATLAETGTVITRYNAGTGTSRVLRGKPLVEQVKDGTGKRLSITTSTWEAMPIAGLPNVPLLRRAVLRSKVTQYEDTTPVRKAEATFEYDTLGRVQRAVDNGRLDLTGDETVTVSQYADDDTNWIRDRACDVKVTNLAGDLASHTQYLFGDNVTQHAPCVVGKGWPRETRAWLASESRFVTSERASYDARGNAISITKQGVERRIAYDVNGLFPIEERTTTPTGAELLWSGTWDFVLGVQNSLADPNGHTTHLTYDALGRQTSVAIDSRPPHQLIEYAWTGPAPKTTTWIFDGPLAEVGPKPPWSTTARWRQSVEVANGRGEVRYRAVRVASGQWIISDYRERDPNSRVVFAGRPVYATKLDHTVRPAGMAGDTLVYDPLGRLIEQRLATGATRTFGYTAFERTVTDPGLASVHSVLDGQNRAVLTERFLPDATREVVQASYDPAGRLTRMWLANNAVDRTFTYDTLGRLVGSSDPDFGARTLRFDDGDRLVAETNAAGQTVSYTYDALGRLATRDSGSGIFRFHYDTPRPGAIGVTNVSGKLAWVEEPTGMADSGYDELGRPRFLRHRIDTRISESTTDYAASGLVLSRNFDDGFVLPHRYDPAGRLVGLGALWSLLQQDAAGAALREVTQNGVDARYMLDALGLPSRVTVRAPSGAAIYDAAATRNPATAITAVADLDGAGLDHSAQFSYDQFSRLTSATMAGFTFGYTYDLLHNMTTRTQTGPRALGSFLGTHRYAEGGRAPRQLTSIVDAGNAVLHQFDYDVAGRQTKEDALTLTYDASDRLLSVTGLPGGTLRHAYGATTDRVKTTAPNGSVTYLFADGTTERNGVREHDVTVGARVVARVSVTPGAPDGASVGLGVTSSPLDGRWWLLVALALAGVAAASRGAVRRRATTAFAAAAMASASCSSPLLGAREGEMSTMTSTFLHAGFSAGPTVFTDAAGNVLEERRYEPFGVAIDARIRTEAGGYIVGAPDVVARDLNMLNKRTEAASGWSDHGARWMAPETARWLTPDPPVQGPSAKLMLAPWRLHPYQYVDQNPIAYWDPDGREPKRTEVTLGDKNVNSKGEAQPNFSYINLTYNKQGNLEGFYFSEGLADGAIDGVTFKVMTGEAGLGSFLDSKGQRTNGLLLRGTAMSLSMKREVCYMGCTDASVDFTIGQAEASIVRTDSYAGLAFEASAFKVTAGIGNKVDSAKISLSAGSGIAVGVHFGDANNNRVPELGLKLKAHHVGIDVKSETFAKPMMEFVRWLRD